MSGRGFEYLRAHGIDVVEDVEHEAAERQHAPFFTWVTRRRPFVIAKVVTSADGFVGQRSARVRLTGPDADRYFHRQRAEIDAIAVGSGTVLADDPTLTARGAYRFRPLTRVIFDWRGRVPETARVFTTVESGPVIMVVSRSAVTAHAERFERMSGRGVAILDAEVRDLAAILARLAHRAIVSLLVEGGPRLHAEFAGANAIDRIQHVITPHRLTEGIPAAPIVPDALRSSGREKRLGDDILMEFDVHRID
jgi:diaminohydroxyphosphoribosylaminopyrimidine deaminase/5-amino-6-(5-phosphoribosylamino)uracil reductase